MNTLFSFDTTFSADSVECHPNDPSILAIGTYQVLESSDSNMNRTGRLYFAQITDNLYDFYSAVS